jgi:ABC-type nitrate/sulfonate/bicarbonate transport system ATPase subunit
VLLVARRVSRRFGSELALAPTDLEVRAGDVLALVGPNGAGKSTMLALLAGALEPTAGTVERRDGVRVGWAPQRPGHYARLSAFENLRLFAQLAEEADPDAAAERDAFLGPLDDGLRQPGPHHPCRISHIQCPSRPLTIPRRRSQVAVWAVEYRVVQGCTQSQSM